MAIIERRFALKLWAFSVFCQRQTFNNWVTQFDQSHCCAMLEAANRDEAEGKALRIARKLFPADDGWGAHHVSVSDVGNVVSVEGATLNKAG